VLREIGAGIKARREELGRLISLEAGKPIRDALVEVDRADGKVAPEIGPELRQAATDALRLPRHADL
jgi:acyl-CoA reductase-like NAD-dependent aldehyde dehydrogenase